MNKQEAIKSLKNIVEYWTYRPTIVEYWTYRPTEIEAAKLAISTLEKTSDKNCSMCIDKGKCAIHDNFNIDYCSDWSCQG